MPQVRIWPRDIAQELLDRLPHLAQGNPNILDSLMDLVEKAESEVDEFLDYLIKIRQDNLEIPDINPTEGQIREIRSSFEDVGLDLAKFVEICKCSEEELFRLITHQITSDPKISFDSEAQVLYAMARLKPNSILAKIIKQ